MTPQTSSFFFRASGESGFPFVEILPVPMDAKLPRSVVELSKRVDDSISSPGEKRFLTGLTTGTSIEDATECLRDYLGRHYPENTDN